MYVWSRLFSINKPMVISVPSGNFGNLTAGLIAAAAGLPVNHFIAATNSNDTVPRFFESGTYLPKPSQSTISNAMDVGNPSNFERMLYLFDRFPHQLDGRISSEAFSDEQTAAAIHELSITSNYQADPHGAVGYLGLKKFLQNQSQDYTAVFLETAHPAKFAETVGPLLHQPLVIPERLQYFANKAEHFDSCENSYEAIKAIVEAH
jgi:threonine synthase